MIFSTSCSDNMPTISKLADFTFKQYTDGKIEIFSDGKTSKKLDYKDIKIVIYTILTAFMAPWGDFIFARYVSFGKEAGYNVAVGLWSWLQKDQIHSKFTMFCTGGVIVAIPVTILFLLLQKYYVEGVTGGAVKG